MPRAKPLTAQANSASKHTTTCPWRGELDRPRRARMPQGCAFLAGLRVRAGNARLKVFIAVAARMGW